MASRRDQAVLRRPPTTFRYTRACRVATERQFRDLLEHGLIARLARGVYRKSPATESHELIEVVLLRPDATLCLQSAFVYHRLLDEDPARHVLAVPPFDLGRTMIRLNPSTRIGIYSAERSIIDAFRLRKQEGPELGHAALHAWLTRRRATHLPARAPRPLPQARAHDSNAPRARRPALPRASSRRIRV